jgi:cbb3-type cytochrome oxidase subunit 1
MMAIKTVNAMSHYTDWTIGHVHSGALGWVAMVTIGAVYHLVPVLFGKRNLYSMQSGQRAFLVVDYRHRVVHRLHVGQRHYPGL